jgi:hypothetical protein
MVFAPEGLTLPPIFFSFSFFFPHFPPSESTLPRSPFSFIVGRQSRARKLILPFLSSSAQISHQVPYL